ncbi:MAG: c-type cytochrome domain-containing protein [Caldilineaceae bacterium]
MVLVRQLLRRFQPVGRSSWSWLLILSFLFNSCGSLANVGPVPPLGSSSLLGIPGHSEAVIAGLKQLSLAEVQSCVTAGNTVYGLTVLNSNVRSEPSAAACRVGRISQAKLVSVSAVITQTVKTVVQESGGGVGYTEDIQPIFLRVCNTCHSSVVQQKGLQVTNFNTLMKGSLTGPVVVPGSAEQSKLWEMVSTNKMPLIGSLTEREKTLIKIWINGGALEKRPPGTKTSSKQVTQVGTWLEVGKGDFDVTSDSCLAKKPDAQRLVSGELILPISCGQQPAASIVSQWRTAILEPAKSNKTLATTGTVTNSQTATKTVPSAAAAATPAPVAPKAAVGTTSVALPASLGLPPPADGDPWMTPRGGICMQQFAPNNQRGITALAFAPSGTLYIALDQNMTAADVDMLILHDPFHPSRSLATYQPGGDGGFNEIMAESSRITGLSYYNGAIYMNRAGEVGRILDGGGYEKLAGGFAVNGPYFHANDGIVVSGGYIYISAGGVRDGYSDGPIVGVGEGAAQEIVSGGNPWAARILRAPLDALITNRNINLFETIGRGVRNPYGLTSDPAGRLWFTDNGASNVPDEISAGDEVNMFTPGATGDASPYFGFPLALNGAPPDWYAKPVVAMKNSSAPTGITWAYGTIYFGTYGVNPGLYRLGRDSSGQTVAERLLAGWPILALTTAPDGAIWMGTGGGGLYRLTPGC